MATRPCYRPLEKFVGYRTVESAPFAWAGGFAFSQKQKNVVSLHDAIHRIDPSAKILEISSKSLQPLGVSLSAFNLKFPYNGAECSVESVFQASKVFEKAGPFPELYSHDSREVRHHVRTYLPDNGSSPSNLTESAGNLSRKRLFSTGYTSMLC